VSISRRFLPPSKGSRQLGHAVDEHAVDENAVVDEASRNGDVAGSETGVGHRNLGSYVC
jgi:hypothetical protein